jgi:TonB family protein
MSDRLKKKCIIGSAIAHAALCGVVFFGAAFFSRTPESKTKPERAQIINVVDYRNLPLTDGKSGGSAPKIQQPEQPQQPAQPEPPPQAEPPRAEPVTPPPTPPPAVVKAPEPVKAVEPEPEKFSLKDLFPQSASKDPDIQYVPPDKSKKSKNTPKTKPKPKDPPKDIATAPVKDPPKDEPKKITKPEIKVDLDAKVDFRAARIQKQKEDQKRADEAWHKAEEARRDAIANSLTTAQKNLSGLGSSTFLHMPQTGNGPIVVDVSSGSSGPGGTGGSGGGPAGANYRDAVFTAYYRAWRPPEDVIETAHDVSARVVVSRDGTILSATVIKRSGKDSLDHSVERALRDVNDLPPFPKESSDLERSFLIIFDLQARNKLG